MAYETFLALRYIRSGSRRRLTRFTAVAAILGISLGVAALIVAFALANGFRDQMREKILQGTAHFSVLRSDGSPMPDYKDVATRVRQVAGVIDAFPTTFDGAVVFGPKSSAYVVLRGVEPAATMHFQQWSINGTFSNLFRSSESTPQAVPGKELAERLGVESGDVIEITPAAGSNSASFTRRRFKVSGTFQSGLYEYDSSWMFVTLDAATAVAGGSHAASVISGEVENVDNVTATADRIRRELGQEFTVIDWKQANQPLFAALSLERRIGVLTIGLIVVMAVLNVATMLVLVVVERRRDVAILNALGATPRGVFTLFIIEGGFIGALGSIAGAVVGTVACAAANHYNLITLPADVYSISSVPLNPRLVEVVGAVVIAFSLSVLATLYPARTAVRMRPVETFREVG
ncbi:MAG: ABC transporter permease [Pyrinomonadaceae bacterium]